MRERARLRAKAASGSARVRNGLVDRLRSRPGLAERIVRLPRLVPSRSARSTLYRTFSWPLIDHLHPRLEVASAGGKLTVDTGDIVGRVLTASGVWEPHVTEAFRRDSAQATYASTSGRTWATTRCSRRSWSGRTGMSTPSSRHRVSIARWRQNLARNGVQNVDRA